LSQTFTAIALEAAVKFDVFLKTVHLDSSSFHLHGEYKHYADNSEISLLPQPTNLRVNEVSSSSPNAVSKSAGKFVSM
jgi:hypothetical protein